MAHQHSQHTAGNNSQRPFSFQTPPENQTILQSSSSNPSHPEHFTHSNGVQPIQTTGQGWSGYPEQRFSYVETPIDDSTQTFDDERTAALLREARERYGDGQSSTPQPAEQQQPHAQNQGLPTDPSQYPPEKQVNRMPSAYQLAPPVEPHPAHAAPYTEPDQKPTFHQPPSQHPAYQQAPPPPVSPGPLPMKRPEDTKKAARASLPQLTSPQFAPPPTSSAPFSPYSATAPDLETQHRPGQIPHPNMRHSKTGDLAHAQPRTHKGFRHGLCACPGSDISTCLMGLLCPCVLYSRLTYRLGQRSRKQDPTDILGFHKCNGHCLGFAALCTCGLSGLLAAVTRGRVRHAYEVEGGAGEDFVEGCCCCCCTIVQSEREVRIREEEKSRWAGPSLNLDSYQRVESMRYPSGI